MTRMQQLVALMVGAAGLAFTVAEVEAQYPGRQSYVYAQYPRPVSTYPPTYHPLYPQVPIFGAHGITGVNPWTHGLDTGRVTVFNTVHDPFREMSKYNGTMRQVNRPAPGGGWERGVEWYNPVTGQWHGQSNIVRPNHLGGIEVHHVARSPQPPRSSRGVGSGHGVRRR